MPQSHRTSSHVTLHMLALVEMSGDGRLDRIVSACCMDFSHVLNSGHRHRASELWISLARFVLLPVTWGLKTCAGQLERAVWPPTGVYSES